MAVTYNRRKKKMSADKEIEIRIASSKESKESVIRFIPSNFDAYFAEEDAEVLADFFLKELPVMTLIRLRLKLNRAFTPTL